MANLLTIIRIIGIFPLIFLINKYGINIYTFIIFVFLSITDFFDGYIARKYNQCTKFGNIIDGVADKLLMVSLTIILLIKNYIPYWSLIIFIRDFLSIFYILNYKKKFNTVPKSNIYGKTKTMLHMISLAIVLLFNWNIISSILLIIAMLLVIPEIIYLYINYKKTNKN